MYAWEAIEQSLTFIEEHLTEEIYTEELANIAGLSPFYFQRLFKRLVNKPVQEYVKLRRLAKVIENLGNTEQRILDAAPWTMALQAMQILRGPSRKRMESHPKSTGEIYQCSTHSTSRKFP